MTLEELMVKVQGDVKPFKDAMAKAKKEAFDAADKIDRALDNMGKGAGKGAMKSIDQTLKKTRSLRDELKILNQKAKIEAGVLKPNQQFRELQATIRATTRELDSLQKKQASMSPVTSKYTDEFKGIKAEYDALGKAFDDLLDKEESMKGFDRSNSGIKQLWDELQDEIAQTAAQLGEYETRMAEMEASGQAYTVNETWYELQNAIEGATADLERYKATEEQMLLSGNDMADKGGPSWGDSFMAGVEASDVVPQRLKTLMGLLKAVGDTAKGAKSGLSSFAATAKAAFQRPIGWLKQLASGFGKVVSKIPLLGRNAKGATSGIGSLFKGLRGVWNIAKMFVIGQGLMGWISATKEGFGNLSVYSASTRASLESLKASLLTLKNAFATAFAPILNVVAPVLAKVIDWCTAAATAVAHLFAALTGKSTVVVARKATSGVASGVGDVGSAADSAKGSVDDLKKSLMGFDQINKLDDNSSGSGGGSGGGGGGGGAAGAGSMFDTVEVGADALSLADKIKEAWKDADFTELGAMIGQKLKTALDGIPWDKIQEIGGKVGKSIATGLNGFFETPGLGTSIGNTIAQMLNTITITADSFAVNFHWDSLGDFIADSINGFFDNYNFSLMGKTLSDFANGLLTTLITAVKKVNWENVGSSIVELIAGIKWVDLLKNAVTLAGSVATAVFEMLQGAITTAKTKLKSWIESGNIWTDLFSIGKTVVDVSVKLLKEGWTTIAAFVGSAVEIAISLLKSGWTKLKDWLFGSTNDNVEAKVKLAKDNWTSIGSFVGETVTTAVKLSKDGWTKIKDYVGTEVTTKIKLAKDGWTKIKDYIGTSVTTHISLAKNGWSSISKYVGTLVTTKIKLIRSGWKSISSFIGTKVRVGISLFKSGWKSLKSFFGLANGGKITAHGVEMFAGGGAYSNGRWEPVTAAASGGSFNQGQFFVAREAGPELVGTIGGNTAVMNNNQIVSSVAAGVARAVSQVMGNGNTSEVHVYLEGDAKQIFRIVKAEAQNYTNSTGAAPFPV